MFENDKKRLVLSDFEDSPEPPRPEADLFDIIAALEEADRNFPVEEKKEAVRSEIIFDLPPVQKYEIEETKAAKKVSELFQEADEPEKEAKPDVPAEVISLLDTLAEEERSSSANEEPAKEEKQESPAAEEMKPEGNKPGDKKSHGNNKLLHGLKLAVLFAVETLLLLALALYGVMFVLAKGPSPTAAKLFVRSVNETSAIGFLSRLYFSEDEIKAMLEVEAAEPEQTKTELITINKTEPDTKKADAWGFVDEDGDGIIVDDVKGEGYVGKMMIVLDPSRVILATYPELYGYEGFTVAEYVEKFGAVAGINGGAFADPGGNGNGSMPEGLVAFEGKFFLHGVKQGFAGIDAEYKLNVGCKSREEAEAANIQYGASYGPVLVQNGEICADGVLESGLNPRTAIGQRSDGAFLLLVIDGRQVTSLGASYLDEAEIMLSYGAVNAINLDGGSSSLMWFGGDYINNCASVIGIRPIPTAFLVLPQK